MAVMDDLLMLIIAIAVAAAVLVGFMVLLYAWALRRRNQLDEEEGEAGPREHPPDGRFEL